MDDTAAVLTSAPARPRRTSAVSQILRAITDDDKPDTDVWQVLTAEGKSNFNIRVASNESMRRKAYSLAYRIYHRCGYVEENPTQMCISPYDGFTGTITLLAEDQSGRPVGTISLVFDSSLGLPCNEIYRDEVDVVRKQGRRLVEVTRLAIDDDVKDARVLLQHLFYLAYIFARFVGNGTDMIVEVNPRHVSYYRRFLRFEQIGSEKACPRVKGAPAILLRMDFSLIENALTGHREGHDKEGRRLHPYPFTREDEQDAAQFMSRHHRPMSFFELVSFEIAGTAAGMPVAAASA